jgi:hypothetical protein
MFAMQYLTSNGLEIDRKYLTEKPPKRAIDLEEVRQIYNDMADLAVIFNHEVVETEEGVWRWKSNSFISHISGHAPVYTPSNAECYTMGIMPYTRLHTKEYRASLSLNSLVRDLHANLFTMEEWMKFYMQIGYSLSGYGEVFGQNEASMYKLPGAKEWDDDEEHDEYCETVIDYMRRIHEGKVLKI